MKPLVYIAGPVSKGWFISNVRNAATWGDCVAKHGGFPYVPHTHGAMFEFILPMGEAFWLEHGLAMVARCDGLLRIPGESAGADKEVDLARSLGIPVWVVDAPRQASFAAWMGYCRSMAREHEAFVEQRAGIEKTSRQRCEWDPERSSAANGEDGCTNSATLCVGANGKWHLCESCAALPEFSRFKTRARLRRRK